MNPKVSMFCILAGHVWVMRAGKDAGVGDDIIREVGSVTPTCGVLACPPDAVKALPARP
jgi:hypothetical protein